MRKQIGPGLIWLIALSGCAAERNVPSGDDGSVDGGDTIDFAVRVRDLSTSSPDLVMPSDLPSPADLTVTVADLSVSVPDLSVIPPDLARPLDLTGVTLDLRTPPDLTMMSTSDAAVCATNYYDCDKSAANGCEANILIDPNNCGLCGRKCTGTTSNCSGGMCVLSNCMPGYSDCNGKAADGCEVATGSDPANCGTCHNSCPYIPNAMAVCNNGVCGAGPCIFGWGDCDGDGSNGCETDLTTTKNCGTCGNACATNTHGKMACVTSKCLVTFCDDLWGNCDGNGANGCETDLANDANNCGMCGGACTGGGGVMGTCSAGMCSAGTCPKGWGDCDGFAGNGCESALDRDTLNCGACGNACPMSAPACLNGACTGLPAVCLLHAEYESGDVYDVQDKLDATGAFLRVDICDAYNYVPTLFSLQRYAAILVWTKEAFKDPVAVGDVLADYYDNGGRVVLAAGATGGLSGRFGNVANGYMLMNAGTVTTVANSKLGTIAEAGSPLLAGVSTLTGAKIVAANGSLVAGATLVASWSDGRPLVVRGMVNARNRVDVNLWPPSKDAFNTQSWTGDGATLLKNALLYK